MPSKQDAERKPNTHKAKYAVMVEGKFVKFDSKDKAADAGKKENARVLAEAAKKKANK